MPCQETDYWKLKRLMNSSSITVIVIKTLSQGKWSKEEGKGMVTWVVGEMSALRGGKEGGYGVTLIWTIHCLYPLAICEHSYHSICYLAGWTLTATTLYISCGLGQNSYQGVMHLDGCFQLVSHWRNAGFPVSSLCSFMAVVPMLLEQDKLLVIFELAVQLIDLGNESS